MPWNLTNFDSTGKIKDERVGRVRTASGSPVMGEVAGSGAVVGNGGQFTEQAGFTVSGTFSDGETITITDSSSRFGTKTQAAPAFFDTVDSLLLNGTASTPYSGVATGDPVPVGPGYVYVRSTFSNYGPVTLETTGARTNRTRTYSGPAAGAWMDYPDGLPDPAGATVDELYLSWWFWSDFDPGDQAGSHKFIRVWDTRDSTSSGVQISWTQSQVTTLYAPGQSEVDTHFSASNWHKLEMWVKVGTGIKCWVDGSIVHDIAYIPPSPLGLQPRLIGWDANAAISGTEIRFTDYYIDTSFQRFELGDSATYSSCTVKEPCPASSWATDSVAISLNLGGHSSISGKHLFFLDATNSATYVGQFA